MIANQPSIHWNSSEHPERIFSWASHNQQVNHLQGIAELYPGVMKHKSKLFKIACALGHIDVINKLFQLNPGMNINPWTMLYVCQGGYVNVATLLLKLDPTLDIFAFNAIDVASEKGHHQLVEWLIRQK